jgi:hypothetical protein
VNRGSRTGALVIGPQLLVAKRTRPTVAVVMVSGSHLVLVICGGKLSAERLLASRCRPPAQDLGRAKAFYVEKVGLQALESHFLKAADGRVASQLEMVIAGRST